MKTDFLGNELEVGDLVIYGSGGGSYKEHLKRGVISDLKGLNWNGTIWFASIILL